MIERGRFRGGTPAAAAAAPGLTAHTQGEADTDVAAPLRRKITLQPGQFK